MKHSFKFLCLLSLAAAALAGAEPKITFPELKDVREPLLLKPYPSLAIDKDGNWLVNGKIRYLLGTQVPSLFGRDVYRKLPGGDPQYEWFTAKAPDYEICQRIGFDTLCTENPVTYIKERFPAFQYELLKPSADGFALEPGLPILMDYTCAPWNNGRPANLKGEWFHHPELAGAISPEALVPKKQQIWVPYSIFHPEGRSFYKSMWESGAKLAKEKKAPVLAYEFFNEPMYNDATAYARKCFAEYLRRNYMTPAKMNQTYNSDFPDFQAASQANLRSQVGLFVDYINFLEDGLVDLCKMGKEAIRAIDPEARFCYQIKGYSQYRNIAYSANNLYKLNKLCEIICVSTSGGVSNVDGYQEPAPRTVDSPANPTLLVDGIMQRHFYRAMADGKPIQNQEMYVGREYDEILSKLWLDHVRGTQACYIFNWASGIQAWKPQTPEGGKRAAEGAPYTMLNCYAVPPENLPAILQAKREIFRFSEFFLPRERNVARKTAVLFSYATEHASGANGYTLKNEFVTYGGALEFSHYPIDVIFEEQLPGKRQNRYAAIIAPGIRNTRPETIPALLEFVRNGGTLILGREFMPEDEHGKKVDRWEGLFDGMKFTDDFNAPLKKTRLGAKLTQPTTLGGNLSLRNTRRIDSAPGWESLADADGRTFVFRRFLGKGNIVLVTAEMPDYALAAVLGAILDSCKIHPILTLRRVENGDLPTNVELHTAKRGECTGIFLYNHDQFPKLLTLEFPPLAQHGFLVDLTAAKSLPVQNGKGLLLLPPKTRMLLAAGPRKKLTDQYGPFLESTPSELQQTYQKQQQLNQEQRQKAQLSFFSYHPAAARTYTVNLRELVNSNFTDSTAAGDGAGGWSDQGPGHGLRGVPWGTVTLLGVPCDLIRPDQNSNRACIILRSKSSKIAFPETVTIPLHDKLKALYFFHTAAWVPWNKKVKAFDYIVSYDSGKKLEIPVNTYENIWDWHGILDPKRHLTAWKNRDNGGFYCWRWENPYPNDRINTVAMRTADSQVIPVLIALTAEKYDPAAEPQIHRGQSPKTYSYGGLIAADNSEEGYYGVTAGSNPTRYAGFVITTRTPWFPMNSDAWKRGSLKFELRGGLDKFGTRRENQFFEVSLARCGAQGKKLFSGKRLDLNSYLNTRRITENWQDVSIPLSALLPAGGPPEGCNQLALRAWKHTPEAGVELRNIRVEFPPADVPSSTKNQ